MAKAFISDQVGDGLCALPPGGRGSPPLLEKAASVPDAALVICTDNIADCFERFSEPGRSVVVVMDDMPARCMELAFDALASGQVDLVFGPTSDGSCYLIGANLPHPGLLQNMDWSAGDALDIGIERAADAGLGWYQLPKINTRTEEVPHA